MRSCPRSWVAQVPWAGFALAAMALPSRVAAQSAKSESVSVSIPCSRSHLLQSAINGRTYPLEVALPLRYCASGANDTTHYPVLFMLDGGMRLAAPYLRFRGRGGQIKEPGLIVVGIGWPPNPPDVPAHILYWRAIDYLTPMAAVDGKSSQQTTSPDEITHIRARALSRQWADSVMMGRPGEATVFLNVVRNEIVPFIDRTYRTTPDRGLFGHSAGAYFVTYVLFEAPDLFARYGISSPPFWWDDYAIFRLEATFAMNHNALPKHIFMAAGSGEYVAIGDVYRMSAALWDRSYEGMHLTTQVVPGDHYSAEGMWRALDTLYPVVR